MRSHAEIMASFSQEIPRNYIAKMTRKSGGKTQEILYCPVHILEYLLDSHVGAGNWWSEITNSYAYTATIGDRTDSYMVVSVRVSIATADRGVISQDGIGNEKAIVDGYGDPTSNAEAQAFRRALAKFGLGRHLWAENPDPEAAPPHPHIVKLQQVLDEYRVEDVTVQDVAVAYLPEHLALADLSKSQFEALLTVVRAEFHPTLGKAWSECFTRLGMHKVMQKADFVVRAKNPKTPEDVLALCEA